MYNIYKEQEITCRKGYSVKVDAGTNCLGYTGYESNTRIVTPEGLPGTLIGINTEGPICNHGQYVPIHMAAWMFLDIDKGLGSYMILGYHPSELYTLKERGCILEEEFIQKKQELSKKKRYLLKHGWLETKSIDPYCGEYTILIDTRNISCQELGYKSGDIIKFPPYQEITIVGAAPKTMGIFGKNVLWCRLGEDGHVMSLEDAKLNLNYEIMYSILFKDTYQHLSES